MGYEMFVDEVDFFLLSVLYIRAQSISTYLSTKNAFSTTFWVEAKKITQAGLLLVGYYMRVIRGE